MLTHYNADEKTLTLCVNEEIAEQRGEADQLAALDVWGLEFAAKKIGYTVAESGNFRDWNGGKFWRGDDALPAELEALLREFNAY